MKRRASMGAWVLAAGLMAACSHQNPLEVDQEVTTLGTAEVTAQLEEIPDKFPPNDLYDYAFVLKYRVLKVHRGKVPEKEILVAQYNPLKPRATVADDRSGKVGGHVDAFRARDIHRMALESPVDQHWMGGIIDKYFNQPGVRYWAVWTNPGSK
ncbi:MAG TPA: hypothetical protein VG672_06100 [Bryobacteraceae bacterium]|nr:hypothetical protein [Bryobacteraceae bacterium]